MGDPRTAAAQFCVRSSSEVGLSGWNIKLCTFRISIRFDQSLKEDGISLNFIKPNLERGDVSLWIQWCVEAESVTVTYYIDIEYTNHFIKQSN